MALLLTAKTDYGGLFQEFCLVKFLSISHNSNESNKAKILKTYVSLVKLYTILTVILNIMDILALVPPQLKKSYMSIPSDQKRSSIRSTEVRPRLLSSPFIILCPDLF